MACLPVISGDDFVRAVRKMGYVWDHTEGSHMVLLDSSKGRLSAPRHKEVDRGLLRALIRDAGLTRDQFIALLRD